ncbi:Cytochrome c5 [Congregibacter litoralis KT71]|uniref:Cytochrome c5 n=2 Tax=Congregibacter TaxID=393661 RepID=A4ABJ9_9GAMM|nr:Cytochrome c5 [Congregibacter litoralis KT71]
MLTRILMLGLTVGLIAAAQAVELTEEQRAAIEARIAPVGEVCLQGETCGGVPSAMGAMSAGGDAMAAIDGEATYNTACLACHASGAAGAPIVGNAESWAPRIAKGIDELYNSGINGIAGSGMMAKGGRADLSDEAVMAAVDYMVENSQ